MSDGKGPLTIPDEDRALISTDLVIYTDGSCIGNKKVRASNFTAGWGAVVLEGATGHISEPGDTNASVIPRGKIWGPAITVSITLVS